MPKGIVDLPNRPTRPDRMEMRVFNPQGTKYRLVVPASTFQSAKAPATKWADTGQRQGAVTLTAPSRDQGSSARSRDWSSGETVSRSPGQARKRTPPWDSGLVVSVPPSETRRVLRQQRVSPRPRRLEWGRLWRRPKGFERTPGGRRTLPPP